MTLCDASSSGSCLLRDATSPLMPSAERRSSSSINQIKQNFWQPVCTWKDNIVCKLFDLSRIEMQQSRCESIHQVIWNDCYLFNNRTLNCYDIWKQKTSLFIRPILLQVCNYWISYNAAVQDYQALVQSVLYLCIRNTDHASIRCKVAQRVLHEMPEIDHSNLIPVLREQRGHVNQNSYIAVATSRLDTEENVPANHAGRPLSCQLHTRSTTWQLWRRPPVVLVAGGSTRFAWMTTSHG